MAAYSWEQGGRKHHSVKKTGTVIFNPNTHVSNSFDDCKELSEDTKTVLRDKLKFTEFLPAQAQTFKGIHNGRDVILHSRTGSGKTLAYAVPILERFLAAQAAMNEEETAMARAIPAAPFLLVFVFGNELAVQTKTVLESVYGGRVNVAVAGFDEITTETPVDVLIGTLPAIDKLIRGTAAAAATPAADEEADAEEDGDADASSSDEEGESASGDDEEGLESMDDDEEGEEEEEDKKKGKAAAKGGKRGRGGAAPAKKGGEPKAKKGHRGEYHRREAGAMGVVSLARTRAVVVDEVDVTMGPKFSTIGRRMKNLLKVVRKSNGSLSEGITGPDFRMHHYVLCGATIPNWVIKAGFLGVKKYYYRLVTAGDSKIPATLECFTYMCPKPQRIANVANLIMRGNLGRTVIFTTRPRVALIETAIKEAIAKATTEAGETAAATPGKKGAKAAKGASSSAAAASMPVLRTLAAEKDELERIACIDDYNSGVATVLLCTDSAARGLDFVAVETVLMESMPDYVGSTDTFVHRAGRTARVANAGRCIWLADPTQDQQRIAQLESVLHIAFKEYPRVGVEAAATARLSLRVAKTLQAKRPAGAAAAPVVPMTPRDVLAKCVDAAKIVAVHATDRDDRVEVEVRCEDREEVRKALWKYDVRIL